MEDNLESGWVSVRPKVFDEKEKHKFVFIVAWNDIDGKFAITCHNRTVQRRSAVLDLDRSPTAEPTTAGKLTKSPSKGVGGETVDVECESHTVGSWAIVTPKEVDLEILDPVDVSPDDPADVGTTREDFSWAGLFSFQDLRAVHQQLCAVNSDLEPCLPSFPEEQSGVWTVLFGGPGLPQVETDSLCYQLQVYLGHALDTCGWKILSQVLFCENEDTDEYYESLGELRQKGYEDAVDAARRRMTEVEYPFPDFSLPTASLVLSGVRVTPTHTLLIHPSSFCPLVIHHLLLHKTRNLICHLAIPALLVGV